MNLKEEIKKLTPQLIEWRHTLHTIPETAFCEEKTSDFIAAKLKEFGVEVYRNVAKTGIVGVLKNGDNSADHSIALRADMDALDLNEENDIEYRSGTPGKMHACGHDGHMTMLLGAAKLLSMHKSFKGTAYLIFQPAEENEGGGGLMVREGLFERFPVKAVFGMHNFPTIPAGNFGICEGPMMAAYDVFDIAITGVGGHAAMPHLAKDPIITATTIVNQLQTIVSRNSNPFDSAVLSVTDIHGGTAYNIIPDTVILRGTTRHFRKKVQETLKIRINKIVEGVCAAMDTKAEIRYEERYPTLVNTPAETSIAIRTASQLVGVDRVNPGLNPIMGSEDFAFMLKKVPGAYIGIGSGRSDQVSNLHQSNYDFNDDILPLGVEYWVSLVNNLIPQ